MNINSTYQSRLGLIYTAWDALWCVWLWLHRSHSMMHTDRSRSKLNICIVDLWSCLLNMHHSWRLSKERDDMTRECKCCNIKKINDKKSGILIKIIIKVLKVEQIMQMLGIFLFWSWLLHIFVLEHTRWSVQDELSLVLRISWTHNELQNTMQSNKIALH